LTVHVTATDAPDVATDVATGADGIENPAIEVQAEAAVEIAQIQADRDVAVAEIAADALAQEEDEAWLRDQFGMLSARLADQAESLSNLQAATESLASLILTQTEALANLTGLLTPQPLSETEPLAEPMAEPSSGEEDGPRESPATTAEPDAKPKRRLQYL
jgi:hypothetical protein